MMSVYVKLENGEEICFFDYWGCQECGEAISPGFMGLYSNCSHQNSSEVNNLADSSWTISVSYIPGTYLNPSVTQDSSGGLIILKGESQLAYYQSGVWISWRSD